MAAVSIIAAKQPITPSILAEKRNASINSGVVFFLKKIMDFI